MLIRTFYLCRFPSLMLPALLLGFLGAVVVPGFAASSHGRPLAATPPMGWNDWAHYQCGYTAQTILANARELVETGLAAHGYNTVTIDDCWMRKNRDAHGDLQVDPKRFPKGMKPVAKAIHAMGLKFGVYEDAGYATCMGFAGSGVPKDGGNDHFLQDARLFKSWGVDYLKLDGCNVYVPEGSTKIEAYRKAYAAEHAALQAVGRPIILSESAPADFQDTPDWYDVLSWVRGYGQLWRVGTDIATFDSKHPENSRFSSVLWNYSYNRPLGRFQKPGNWDDADFIIGGDHGMSLPETRSQLALWSMMSAPLILSSDIGKLSPRAITILSNKAVLAIDQDPLGKMATLVRRTSAIDVLFKELNGGDYAVAVLNREPSPIHIVEHPVDFGFSGDTGCRLDARNLWNGTHSSGSTLEADVSSHDTVIWRVRATSSCHTPKRTGTITMDVYPAEPPSNNPMDIDLYTQCLAAPGRVESCAGTAAEQWTVTQAGTLESAGRCLAAVDGKPELQSCDARKDQHWKYTLVGNLVDVRGECLTVEDAGSKPQNLTMRACGHNQPNQIWSLPN